MVFGEPERASPSFGTYGFAVLLQRTRHLRRHVLLVVLGEHFVRDEHPVRAHAAVGDDALALTEQIGQHARVFHLQLILEVGDHEVHVETAGLPMEAALLHHAAEAEALARLHFAGGDLGGVEEEHHVLLERRQRERAGDADSRQNAENPVETTFACRGHDECPSSGLWPDAVPDAGVLLMARAPSRLDTRALQRAARPENVESDGDDDERVRRPYEPRVSTHIQKLCEGHAFTASRIQLAERSRFSSSARSRVSSNAPKSSE